MAERQNGQTEPTMTDFAGLLLADPWHDIPPLEAMDANL